MYSVCGLTEMEVSSSLEICTQVKNFLSMSQTYIELTIGRRMQIKADSVSIGIK